MTISTYLSEQYDDARHIEPLHQPYDDELLASLVESLRADGWQGRPLVALDIPDAPKALTGSHRLAAINQIWAEDRADVLADILWVEGDMDDLYRLWDARDDDERLEIALEMGDDDLVDALRAEIAAAE